MEIVKWKEQRVRQQTWIWIPDPSWGGWAKWLERRGIFGLQDLITKTNEVPRPLSCLCVCTSWLFPLSKAISLGCWIPALTACFLCQSIHLSYAMLLGSSGHSSLLNLFPLDSYSCADIWELLYPPSSSAKIIHPPCTSAVKSFISTVTGPPMDP